MKPRGDEIKKKAERVGSIRLAIGQALALGEHFGDKAAGEYTDGTAKLEVVSAGMPSQASFIASLTIATFAVRCLGQRPYSSGKRARAKIPPFGSSHPRSARVFCSGVGLIWKATR